jgi:hypothetical protein
MSYTAIRGKGEEERKEGRWKKERRDIPVETNQILSNSPKYNLPSSPPSFGRNGQ